MSVILDEGGTAEHYCPTCETGFAGGKLCPTDGTQLVTLAPPVDPHVGRELDGRFTIIEKLGHGGMGAVYRAVQHSVGREVAVKVIHPNLLADPMVIKRFLREARLASRLSHPNAVAVLDFGQTGDGIFYLAMELIGGRTLERELTTGGTFGARRLVRIGVQICDALEAAHGLQIIHRDLKPANIMLLDGVRDFVKVLDFGLAKSLDAPADHETSSTGSVAGTPAYVSPERARGLPGDARSDLYTLGCILYLLGARRLPFVAGSVPELLAMHARTPARPMTGVPFALSTVIDRLLRKDPEERYQTAAEVREALEESIEGIPSESFRLVRPPSSGPIVVTSAIAEETPISLAAIVPVTPSPVPGNRPPTAAERERLASSDTMRAMPPVKSSTWLWVGVIASLVMIAGLVVAWRSAVAIRTPDRAPAAELASPSVTPMASSTAAIPAPAVPAPAPAPAPESAPAVAPIAAPAPPAPAAPAPSSAPAGKRPKPTPRPHLPF